MKELRAAWMVFLSAIFISGPAYSGTFSISKTSPPAVRKGMASWYSPSDPGVRRITANGELFKGNEKTCASWHYGFGTFLKVTNQANGKSVVCRVNDRGPAKRFKKRIIDLSRTAFKEIAHPRLGLVQVAVAPVPEKSVLKKTHKPRS